MNSLTESENSSARSPFFRCPVQADCSQALIRIGYRSFNVSVQERSIDGFTVLVPPKYARRLKVGRRWTMHYDGAEVEVHPQWFFSAPDGHVQIGLRLIRDITKMKLVQKSIWSRLLPNFDLERTASSSVALGGFVLVLFCSLALPGLGDKLGTSKRIENSVRWMVDGADSTLRGWLR